jgi:hypothetical protein
LFDQDLISGKIFNPIFAFLSKFKEEILKTGQKKTRTKTKTSLCGMKDFFFRSALSLNGLEKLPLSEKLKN